MEFMFDTVMFGMSQSTTLLKNVNLIGGVINSNNTLPILDNFLFELDGSQLRITGSDLETTISTTLEVESNDSGKIAIPSKILTDTLKTFPHNHLLLSKKKEIRWKLFQNKEIIS